MNYETWDKIATAVASIGFVIFLVPFSLATNSYDNDNGYKRDDYVLKCWLPMFIGQLMFFIPALYFISRFADPRMKMYYLTGIAFFSIWIGAWANYYSTIAQRFSA